MAKSKTYELAIKIMGKVDSSLAKACRDADKNLSTLSETAAKVGNAVKTGMAVAGTAVAAIATTSLNTYSEYEQAMANTAAIAGAQGEAYDQLAAAAREMGAKTTKTATEAAEALGYMALAGWDVQQSIDGLEPILRLSEATQMDLARCSDLVTDSMSALGLGVGDMMDYLNLAVQTNNKANTTAESLMEAFIGCGGAAKTTGVDMLDLSTALGILANNGTKGAEAGTAMNAMLVRMTSKDAAIKAMKQLGVSAFDAQGNFRGLETVFGDLSKAMANLSTEERAAYMSQIAGTNYYTEMSYLLDAVAESADGTANAWQNLEDQLAQASTGNGALMTMAGQVTNTLHSAKEIFMSAVQEAQLTIGEQLAPYAQQAFAYLSNEVLPAVTEQLRIIIPQLIELAKHAWENRETILTIAGAVMTAVGAFKALKTASAAVGAVKSLSTTFKAASTSGGLLSKVLGLGGVKMALIAAAIALVVTGLVHLWKNSEQFRETVMGIWAKLQPLFQSFGDMLTAVWEKVGPLLQVLGGILLKALERAVILLAPVVENLIGVLTGITDFIGGIFSGDTEKAMEGLQTIFKNALSALGNLAKAGFTAILEIGSAIWPLLDQAVMDGIAAIGERFPALGEFLGTVWSSIQAAWENVQAIFENIIDFIDNVFSGNWSGAWENIVNIFGNVFGLIVNLAKVPINAVISAINWVLGKINSISVTIPDWVPGVGGTTLGFNIPTIPTLAAGGIATAPTLAQIGEGGEPEAVLPLSKLAAMLDDIRSPKPADNSGGGDSYTMPAPVFHFHFDGQVTREQAEEAGRVSFAEFKRLYERMKAEERRKSFTTA